MDKDSDKQYQKILESRAKRKGISLEQAEEVDRSSPLFFSAAEAAAERLGTSAEEVMQADLRGAADLPLPGDECLTPDEIEAFVAADDFTDDYTRLIDNDAATGPHHIVLTEDRLDHLDECKLCSALLAASRPILERRLQFERVFDERDKAGQLEPELEPELVPATTQRRMFFSDVFSSAAAVVSLFLLGYVFVTREVEIPASAFVVIGLFVLILAVGYIVFRAIPRSATAEPITKWRSWRFADGAVVVLFAVAPIVFFAVSKLDAAYDDKTHQLALSKLQQLALTSIEHRERAGVFLETPRSDEEVSFTTASLTSDSVVYHADVSGMRGKLIAEIGPIDGKLFWVIGEDKKLEGKILVGEVQDFADDELVLHRDDEEVTRIGFGYVNYRPTLGSRVAVAYDANSNVSEGIMLIADSN